jgi:hypothetical protein
MKFILGLGLLSSIVVAQSEPRVSHMVALDITSGGKSLGRITLGLFGDVVPYTGN